MSVVLLPGTLNRLVLSMTSPFCFANNASWCLLLWRLPLNRIHLKIISAATFFITKIVARLDLPNNDGR